MRLSGLSLASLSTSLSLLITSMAAPLAAQSTVPLPAAPPPPPGPTVGAQAPDFTLPGATRYGLLRTPITLSQFRGRPIVLAFFPRARTSGCTKQLEAYRDQYATLFHGGRGVTLIAVSTDADTTLASWARDADFPMVLLSDTSAAAGRAYGAYNERGKMDSRFLYVIGADGKITYADKPFNVSDPAAYTRLRDAVDTALAPRTVSER